MKIIRIFNIRSEMKFDVEHIDSIESLNFKLFVLERVLFGDVSNFTPITGRRTTTEFDLFQASQVQDHSSKKAGTSKGSSHLFVHFRRSILSQSVKDVSDSSVPGNFC